MFIRVSKRFLKLFLQVIIVTVLFGTTILVQAAGNQYYVSTSGNDNNSGTIDKPWKSINYAVKKLKPGDTLYIREGVYNETVNITASGSKSGGYITISAYPGEKAVLDGTGLDPKSIGTGMFAMINISDQSYIKIEGLEIRNYKTTVSKTCIAGINVDGACQNIEIRNNYIHDIKNLASVDRNLNGRDAHGICVYGTESKAISGLVIDGNTITDCVLGSSEALTLNGNVDGFAVTNNKVYNNDNIGICFIGYEDTAPTEALDRARNGICRGNIVYNIDSYGNPAYGEDKSADGIYCDGATNIVIEKNIVHHANFGIELASEHKGKSTSNITVRNNIVYNCDNAGLALGGYDKQRGNSVNNIITNNTFYHNDTRKEGFGEVFIQYDTRNNIIKNNIFYANNNGTFIYNEYKENTGNVIDYNIYYSDKAASNCYWTWKNVAYKGFEQYKSKTGNDQNSLFINPQFKNASAQDFSLQSTSPAINAGDPSFVPQAAPDGVPETDIVGNNRVAGNRVDCGAYEVQNIIEVKPAPEVSDIQVDVDSQNVTITWKTNTSCTSAVVYGKTTNYANKQEGKEYVTEHQFVLKGLDPGTTYYYRIEVTDDLGQKTVSDSYTFTTKEIQVPEVEEPEVEEPVVPLPSPQMIDDNSSKIKYSSGWRVYKDYGDYKKSHHETTKKGAYATFTFTGTSVSWISQKDMNYGIAEVYIDGVLEATIDLYAPSTTYQQVVFSKSNLKYGKHTIKIVCKGEKNRKSKNKYVTIDAFSYY